MTTDPAGVRRFVVTGAGSGIGAALTDRLVTSGHEVVALDRAASGVPDGAEPLACDLTDPAAVEAAVAAVRATGPLHGVAAVAGVPGSVPPPVVHAVNVVGLRRVVGALAPLLTPGSAVVLLSSMAGYRGTATPDELDRYLALDDDDLQAALEATALDGPGAYQLSKQVVHALAVDLAATLHPRGVRAVSVSPGPVETPILADFRATMPTLDEASRLVGRNARADEVAAVVEFVLSPAASWLNGIDLRLDGGLTALRARAVR
ncbi:MULTISPECIES: SDR family oxidoreductase [unclassified Pseudonocardia]|uniref:SDR family oxidoreductase n=1 Tax=unclassified Pseudonocardia TaxID=2619320 RepID=UPI001CF6427F|nr:MULTISPECIES: SDR family oxidoreductase [unclassified Pseudonocardia]